MINNVYCTAPWNGVTIREDGLVRTCCVGKSVLANLHKDSVESIESSAMLDEIKESLLQGQVHRNCELCVNQENNQNLAPLRQHYLKHYPDIDHNLKLKFVDIRWNNRCNLACMYCNSSFSSTWENKLTHSLKQPAVKQYQDELLEWILDRADHIQEIMLVGGEPMLMKQNYELLNRLPKTSRISIITNLSYDFEKLVCLKNLMSRPRENVVWNISVENVGKQFEYVRNGADWVLFEKNTQLVSKLWPDTVSLNMVYSLFSALNLHETVKFYHSLGINKVTLLPITDNYEIDVFRMPPQIKQLALQSLAQLQQWHTQTYGQDAELYPIAGIEQIKIGLESNNGVVPSLDQVARKIQWYDSYNSDTFQNLWPAESKLLNELLV